MTNDTPCKEFGQPLTNRERQVQALLCLGSGERGWLWCLNIGFLIGDMLMLVVIVSNGAPQ